MAVDLFNTAGSFSWTCPSGVTTALVEAVGGSGPGQGSLPGQGGKGGGGGAYAANPTVPVTAGSTYSGTVGSGGTANANGLGSTFTGDAATTVTATFGLSGTNGGTGGQSAACSGTTKYSGGNGGAGQVSVSGGGGGGGSSAGSTGAGNNGTAGSAGLGGAGGAPPDADAGPGGNGGDFGSANAANGQQPGGGGGGGGANDAGAAGASGWVRITYTDPSSTASGVPLIPAVETGLAHSLRTAVAVLNSLSREGELTQTDVTEYTLFGASGVPPVIPAASLPPDIAYTDVANVFTVSPQTIDIDADARKGLVIKAHSATQTANLLELQTAGPGAGSLGFATLATGGTDTNVGLWLKLQGQDDSNFQTTLLLSPTTDPAGSVAIATGMGSPVFLFESNGNSTDMMYRCATSYTTIYFVSSNGTLEAPTASLPTDELGQILFKGYKTSDSPYTAASMYCYVTGVTASWVYGALAFNVAPHYPFALFHHSGVLALPSGVQFSAYNEAFSLYADLPTDWERASVKWSANVAQVGSEAGGAGTLRPLQLLGAGVGIGTGAPSASATFQIDSTTQGFLPPRMTTTQKNAISSPAEGLVVHDSTLHALYYYNGSAWTAFGSGGEAAANAALRATRFY